jgi:lipopolysaccharide transport system permease protein
MNIRIMLLLEYKELLKNLIVTDLKMKYSSSVLGFAWSMLNPLFMMIVLYFVFHNMFSSQQNFILYLLTGLITWRFFAIGTTSAMSAIVAKSNLVTKINIPREILPLSISISCLISSTLEFTVLIPLLLILGGSLSQNFIFFPVLQLLYFLIVYGVGLILSSLYVYYRDLNQIWDIVLQAGFFLCPIVYSISLIPDKYLFIYMLNPITRLMEMYRDILIYGMIPPLFDFFYVIIIGVVLCILGEIIFSKLSRRFAEGV